MHLATMSDDHKSGSRSRSARYMPPANVVAVPFSQLLAAGNRDALQPKQMDFLRSVTKSDGAQGRVYTAGNVALLNGPCIAVIGARKVSEAGRRRARQIGRQLAEAGVVVVSGLAEGVDTEALSGAIDARGSVVAVIGTPINEAYPAKNKVLQEEILPPPLADIAVRGRRAGIPFELPCTKSNNGSTIRCQRGDRSLRHFRHVAPSRRVPAPRALASNW